MARKYNYYDTVIEDLRYYANDKRRSQDYRTIIATAANALSAANQELKEAEELIERIGSVMSATMDVLHRVKRYTEE